MLTTPERSPSTPLIAPKTRGTATASDPASSPTTGKVASAAAQVKKPVSQTTAKTTTSQSRVFLRWVSRAIE